METIGFTLPASQTKDKKYLIYRGDSVLPNTLSTLIKEYRPILMLDEQIAKSEITEDGKEIFLIKDSSHPQDGIQYYGPEPIIKTKYDLNVTTNKLSNQTYEDVEYIDCLLTDAVDATVYYYAYVEINDDAYQIGKIGAVVHTPDKNKAEYVLQVKRGEQWEEVRKLKPGVTASLGKSQKTTSSNPLFKESALSFFGHEIETTVLTTNTKFFLNIKIPNVFRRNNSKSIRPLNSVRLLTKIATYFKSSEPIDLTYVNIPIERVEIIKYTKVGEVETLCEMISCIIAKDGRYDEHLLYEGMCIDEPIIDSHYALISREVNILELQVRNEVKKGESIYYKVILTDAYGVEHLAFEERIII